MNSLDQFKSLGPFPSRARVIRMHGDFWHGNVLNTEGELEQTPEIRFNAARLLFQFYGLVVIGYGGADVKLMGSLFNSLWKPPNDNVLSKGLYWCVRKGTPKSPLLESFLTYAPADRVYIVEIDDFDSLMARLAAPFAPEPRTGTVDRINRNGLIVIRDDSSGDVLVCGFDQIAGYRGQTAGELGLRAGAKVRYRSSDSGKVHTVELVAS